MIAFRVLASIHEPTSIGDRFIFGSLRFFYCQQHTYKHSEDNRIFGRKLHRELANVAEGTKVGGFGLQPRSRYSFYSPTRTYKSPQRKSGVRGWPSRGLRTIRSRVSLRDSSSTSSKTYDSRASCDILVAHPPPIFGGIKVHRDVNIDVCDKQEMEAGGEDTEMSNLGYFSEIGLDEEGETFAEMLVAITVDERRGKTVI